MDNIKKFEDFLDRMQGLLNNAKKQGHIIVRVEDLENAFPELKESDDERIRKALINGFNKLDKSAVWYNGITNGQILAWLEKQNEQKPVFEMKTPEESLGIDSETYNKIVDECIYGVQKLANKIEPKDYSSIDPHFFKTTDKIEPKFKVGDNIEPIDSCLGSPRTIYKICDGFYETNQGTLDFEFENNWRLTEQKPAWSEEDELMLVSIIQTLKLTNGSAQIKIDWLESIKDRVQPQPKQEWTEEDEKIIKRIDSLLYAINESDFEDIHAWLEFLKNRVQPKQEWSEKDKHMLQKVIDFMNHPDLIKATPTLSKSTINWLEFLKERYTWKPGDEQMKQLGWIAKQNKDNMIGKELMSLYQDLKKLKE